MRPALIMLTAFVLFAAEPPEQRHVGFTRVFPAPDQIGLFVANADGGNEHALLSPAGIDYDAAWAPDGASLVFTSERDGSADLFRVKPDGSGLTQLTKNPAYDDQAAFSPDGKQLVFVSTRAGGRANLWTLDLATLRTKQLTPGAGGDFRPAWSPDGKWIVFSSDRESSFPFGHGRWERLQLTEIYVIRPDGSGLRKVTNTGGFCGSPKWTRDSAHVVAFCMTGEQTLPSRSPNPAGVGDTRLVSIDIATGALADVSAGPGVKFNPSPLAGNDIGYIRKDTKDAGIYYTDGRRGPKGNVREASWSPDGTRVVFHRRLPGGPRKVQETFSRDAKYELNLMPSLSAYSPSRTEYVSNSAPTATPRGSSLSVTNVATGTTRVLYEDKTRNVLAGAWSPRGDRVAFGVGGFFAFFGGLGPVFLKEGDRVEDGAQVAIVNADGTGFEALTPAGSGNNAFPSFAPDGKRLVYRSFSKDGYGLRIMNLETKSVTALTREYDNFPLWSPRGDLIMFSRLVDGSYDIHTIRPDGTGLKRLTFTKGNDAHQAWSPDGEYIVFASSRMGFKDETIYTDAPQPYGEIFAMRYDGTGVEQLTDNQWEEGTPAWIPAGKP
ncbi:MAG: PD40 domain-containing protein [Acidobacteriota bacterium]|nr:PD40 domain-containing protein [Acidobacteriota bacterium]